MLLVDPDAAFGNVLQEVLDEKQKRMIQELDHTDTIDYERMLRQKLDSLEGIMGKVLS